MPQLSLFDAIDLVTGSGKTELCLPREIEQQLDRGAALAISISGGKDSQAMIGALVALHASRGWTGDIFCIHADLGRIEWRQTPGHVAKLAADAGLELVTVRRFNGQDMIDRWVAQGEKHQAQGKQARPWSDAGNRFCTSDMKRDPIDNYLRRFSNVVCAVGIRREEGAGRKNKAGQPIGRAAAPEWAPRRINNTVRTATTWHPLLYWTVEDVLQACGHSQADLTARREQYAAGLVAESLDGWSLHPAYVFGNERLSCQFCVLASCNDLSVGAADRPELLEELIAIEERFGFTFQADRSLKTFRTATAGNQLPTAA